MRLAAVACALAAVLATAPARAATPPPTKKQVVMHYRMLEKMLRRFSLQAGSARTRG